MLTMGIFWLWRQESQRGETAYAIIANAQSPVSSSTAVASAPKEIQVTSTTTPVIIEPQEPVLVSTTIQEPVSDFVLPAHINLTVPFAPQAPEKKWDQPWQDACEEASVLMLDAYYKKYSLSPLFVKDEILKMVAWEENLGWDLSIDIDKLKILLEKYFGLNKKQQIKIVSNPTIDQIKEYVATGHPVLVVANGKELPNPHYRNGGPEYHVLIIRGYTESEFITNDPGTQFGENFKFKYNDLMLAIHDWNGGNVKEGERKILVIE